MAYVITAETPVYTLLATFGVLTLLEHGDVQEFLAALSVVNTLEPLDSVTVQTIGGGVRKFDITTQSNLHWNHDFKLDGATLLVKSNQPQYWNFETGRYVRTVRDILIKLLLNHQLSDLSITYS
mgnify:CR=1 FL=1